MVGGAHQTDDGRVIKKIRGGARDKEGSLKFMKDKVAGDSNLAERTLRKKDKLNECLRSARIDR